MSRLTVILFVISLLTGTVCQASEPDKPQPEIRAYESNSTDELGILQTLIKAQKHYERQDFQNSAQLFSLIVKFDPSLDQAVIGLGESYISLGRADAALKLLKTSPVQTDASKRLEVLAKALMMKAGSRELFLKAAIEETSDPRLLNLYAKTLEENGKFAVARVAYQKAEALGQKPGVFLNNLGMMELKRGNTEIAVALLFRAQESAPSWTRFNNNYRLALLLKGDYVNALEKLESDRAADFLVDGGFIAMQQNEVALAKLLFEKANSISPVFHPRAQYGLTLTE